MANDTFQVLVESANGTALSLPVHAQMTVYELKKVIRARTNELVKDQKLFYEGNEMKFHDWALSLYGIENVPGVTHRIKLKVFHENLIQTLPLKHIHAAIGEKYLSPKWHVDLRNVTDNGKTRFRGGRAYNRPLGCMRFGIRVLDKHEDNKWIGLKGVERVRTNTHGEWPVAYHGTSEQSVLSILEEGFRLDKGKRFSYGHGIYCTPDPKTALAYAFKSVYQGEELRLIIQCRVDPAKVQVVAKPAGFGEFWLVPSGQEIRPYAVCAYEKPPDPARPLVSVQQTPAQRNPAQRNPARPLASAQNSTYQQQSNAIRSQIIALLGISLNRNIYARASTNNTPNPILNSGNPLASLPPTVSSSTIYNGNHNTNSQLVTWRKGTSYQSTSNNALNPTSNSGSWRSYANSTHGGGALPARWQGPLHQGSTNNGNNNISNGFIPRGISLNTIQNSGNPRDSQSSSGSSSITYNGNLNTNSSVLIQSALTRVATPGASYQSTNNQLSIVHNHVK
ncbi:poly(ADP-ribose) polymerase catalytic domain-containing protein [Ditylenchus destructor]|nr:poly(ADP-ribose) polymerase catalytic domain-containing protein [Ditylenchus destructor]